ncbi:hypothetical protein Dimus_029817 [Dionaea muscipula]
MKKLESTPLPRLPFFCRLSHYAARRSCFCHLLFPHSVFIPPVSPINTPPPPQHNPSAITQNYHKNKHQMNMMRGAILFFFLLLTVLMTVGVRGKGSMVGGKMRINDVESNKEVQDLGRYSVEEFNRVAQQGRLRLEFVAVVEAYKQVVSGTKYYLKIDADADAEQQQQSRSQSRVRNRFDAVVLVQPWLRSKKLLTFAPSATN